MRVGGGHLIVVAQPLSSDPQLLLDQVPDRNLRPWASALQLGGSYSPNAQEGTHMAQRSHGVARTSYEIGPDRSLRPNGDQPPNENHLWELEIREDGGVRLFNGRASDTSRGPAGVFGALIGGETSNVVEVARQISDLCGFHGSWTFGVGIVGLRGQSAFNPDIRSSEDPYSDDAYTQVHEASAIELTQPGSPILDALLGRFCRSSLPSDQSPQTLDQHPQSSP